MNKPFDYEAVKRGEPVMQRCGKQARYIGERIHRPHNTQFHLLFEVEGMNGEWVVELFTVEGRSFIGSPNFDIVMAPKKAERWARAYRGACVGEVMVHVGSSEESLSPLHAKWIGPAVKIWEGFEGEE